MNHKHYLFTLLLTLIVCATTYAQPSATNPAKKMNFLIHITCGPENPTKAALAFLVAKTALDEGHTVSLFLAGDAAPLLKDAELDKVVGVGTGKLREHYEAIVKAGGKFYVSGMSAKARGMTEADIAGKPAEFAMPTKLVKLAADSDRMFTY
jgi:predicted peroxiredoxin